MRLLYLIKYFWYSRDSLVGGVGFCVILYSLDIAFV